jgi:hypothetical protein
VKAAVKIEKILFKFLKREIPDIVALKKGTPISGICCKMGKFCSKKRD